MIKKRITLLLFCYLLAGPLNLLARTGPSPLVIGTFFINDLVESPDKGVMVEILHAAARASNLKLEIRLLSPKRSRFLLENGDIDGFFPYFVLSAPVKNTIQTPAFYLKREYLAVRKEAAHLTTDTISSVCMPKGFHSRWYMNLAPERKKAITLRQSPNDESCVRMLISKRVDAFIMEDLSGREAIKQLDVAPKVHIRSELLGTTPITLLLRPNALNSQQLTQFKREIAARTWTGAQQKSSH